MEESPSPKPELESTTTTLTCRDSELSNSNSSFCSSEVMLPNKNNDRGEVVNGYIVYSRRKTKNLHEEEEEKKAIVKVEEESSEVVVIQNDVVLGRMKRNRKPTWKTVVDECEVGEEEKAVVFKMKSAEKKVVVVNRRPVTVKELFDTGLLDGVPVFYIGCKKMSEFVVPVFHHGGRFETLANGELRYIGGVVKKYESVDVDFVNKEDILVQVRDLGYLEHSRLFWHDPTVINFEDGLHELSGDMEVNEMCEFSLNHNLKAFHIYIEHVVNVAMQPEDGEGVVISSSSSSSDDGGYESAEDEPYKPPPPGFESESSEGVSASVKLKKKKGKSVAARKKKYAGKRRKQHVLSGSASGSGGWFGDGFGAGSGSGSGSGVGHGNGSGVGSGIGSGVGNGGFGLGQNQDGPQVDHNMGQNIGPGLE